MILQLGKACAEEELGCAASGAKNAARHVDRVVQRFNLALPVKTSWHTFVEDGQIVNLPYLRPGCYLKQLLERNSDLVLGGYNLEDEMVGSVLQQFWSSYAIDHPSHEIYAWGPERLSRTIPYCLHGDGGRTQKKLGLDIISWEPTLGLNSKRTACSETSEYCSCPDPKPVSNQRINSRWCSYLSRFLIVAFPGKKYPDGLLQDVMRNVSQQLQDLHENGLLVRGRRLFFTCVGFKSDMEYMSKILRDAGLTRSYEHLGSTNSLEVCHECKAGRVDIPFEDTHVSATWTQSLYRSLAWTGAPCVNAINFEPWQTLPSKAAMFFRRDPLHIFRLGALANQHLFSTLAPYMSFYRSPGSYMIRIHTYMYTYICIQVYLHIYIYICTYKYTFNMLCVTHAYTHIHVYIYIYIYTHVY